MNDRARSVKPDRLTPQESRGLGARCTEVKRWFLRLVARRRAETTRLVAVALAIAAVTLAYRGPGRALVRGHLGDVAAPMLVYALLGLAWRARPATRAAATFAIALVIEAGQLVWHARSTAGQLLVGAHFDPLDMLAYAIGTAIAFACELRHLRQAARVAGSSDVFNRCITVAPLGVHLQIACVIRERRSGH